MHEKVIFIKNTNKAYDFGNNLYIIFTGEFQMYSKKHFVM